MSKKIKVGVLFGGASAEHEVSLVTGESVIRNLNKKKYKVIPVGISKSGQWLIGSPLKYLKNQKKAKVVEVIPPTNFKSRGLVETKKTNIILSKKIDVFFPVVHGTFGEDGTLQGMLEMTSIPFVGAGMRSSVLGMDKVLQKQIYKYFKISTPDFYYFYDHEWKKDQKKIINKIVEKIKFPNFVKPANLGSSVGISKVYNLKFLKKAINLALKYDNKIIVEKSIEKAREIEISVLGNENPKVSKLVGEILPSNDFYDYNAKYIDGKSKTVVNPRLKKNLIEKIKSNAKKAYMILECTGMARVDFLVKGNSVYINELNTIPGFTSISMYPMLWSSSGLTYTKLLDELIQLAFENQKRKSKLNSSYRPSKKWYL